MKTFYFIIAIILSIVLFTVKKEVKQLREENHKLKSKIELLNNQNTTNQIIIYRYEMAAAHLFERYRSCGILHEKILKNIKQ